MHYNSKTTAYCVRMLLTNDYCVIAIQGAGQCVVTATRGSSEDDGEDAGKVSHQLTTLHSN